MKKKWKHAMHTTSYIPNQCALRDSWTFLYLFVTSPCAQHLGRLRGGRARVPSRIKPYTNPSVQAVAIDPLSNNTAIPACHTPLWALRCAAHVRTNNERAGYARGGGTGVNRLTGCGKVTVYSLSLSLSFHIYIIYLSYLYTLTLHK